MPSYEHQKLVSVVVSVFTAALLVLATPAQARVLDQFQRLEDYSLDSASTLVFSPDGRHLYVGAGPDSAVLERDPVTGEFTFVETFGNIWGTASQGAISPDGRSLYMIFVNNIHDDIFTTLQVYRRDAASGKVILFEVHEGAFHDVEISPDGRYVYVTDSLSIHAFSRDAVNGALTPVATYDDQTTGWGVFSGAGFLAFSPDGAHMYLTHRDGSTDGLAAFTRDPATGELSFLEDHRDGVGGVDGLSGVDSIVASADGRNIYVGSFNDRALAVFARAPDGTLTFLEFHAFGTGPLAELHTPEFLTLSPGGDHLYVTTLSDVSPGRVGAFTRSAGTGSLSLLDSYQVEGVGRLAVHPDGEQLLLAGGGLHGVLEFARATTGELTAMGAVGVGEARGFIDGRSATVSPDGKHLYMASWADNAVSVFARDEVTGELSFLEAYVDGEAGIQGLAGVSVAIVSVDGRHLYAMGREAVAVFARDAGGGALTLLEIHNGTNGDSLGTAVAMSGDGRHLYFAADNRAVAVYSRDPVSGSLTFLESHFDDQNGVDGLRGADSVVVSPDDRHVYVTGQFDHAVSAFARDAASGSLSFLEARFDDQDGVDGLDGASSLAISPDGEYVFVVGRSEDALAVFRRDAASGSLSFLEAHFDNVNGVDGLDFGRSVVVSPDLLHVFVASFRDDSVAVFARDAASGRFRLVELQRERVGGVEGMAWASALALSPDGRHVYTAAGSGIVAFSRNDGPCLQGPTALCLQGNRFRAEVEWRTPAGEVGMAKPLPYGSDDSGLFWFFSPDNWELQIKVLDACAARDRFWVFAAATTNVEYTLRVTDTFTGDVKEYFNPLGQASPAITDTGAFATCAAPSPTSGSDRAVATAEPIRATPVDGASAVSGSVKGGAPFFCRRSPSKHCLGNSGSFRAGRFEVTLEWRNFQGETGTGRVVYVATPDDPTLLEADDSGLFWFFEPDNWEMQIKVLDGCGINGHYWLFAAGTTNVEYTLTVTDSETGTSREYFNSLGNASPAITDTTAFASCP